ncbi:uncharacterized protein BHQ10_001266 [Talaromyces amestolkiae]|uniref:NmrA-like domain-containing protein n=1 Tax=Talaromyces amestolkiae TaxID=1196081 RepID=A0A364KNY1_TALAM|nr:uncharacterized protein BHQ10_001266 [Talaromyces amestolkiae]RAO65254.1 hypothetical protein BHQ10_001266 [Talaromyces amestolkiae]
MEQVSNRSPLKVAVAGGSGQVAREIIDALLAAKKHEIVILSRSDTPVHSIASEIRWQKVDYEDKKSLVETLRGTHTLLSFVQILSDPDQMSQKNLIDAAITAGVKRFAPSEYGSKDIVNMSWWCGKGVIREYLEKVNGTENVLEYTLFQPGLFLDYLAYPFKTSKYLDPLQTFLDFANRRAMVVDDHEYAAITFTTVSDLAAVVARAIDYDGKWPVTGGIRGNRVTFSQIIDIGRRIRGSLDVTVLKVEDLEFGDLKSPWNLQAVHHAVPDDQAQALLKQVAIGFLLSSSKGAWDVSDDFNRIFPDFEFTSLKDFLTGTWEDKP